MPSPPDTPETGTPADASGRVPAAVAERAAGVRLMVLDVDGVLTDGRIVLGDDGNEHKTFHTHDGHGLGLLQASGVAVALITGRRSPLVERRAAELRIAHVIQGRSDKAPALGELLEELGLGAESAAYVGDDVVDLPAIRRAGLGIAVADATPMTRAYADYVTAHRGGHGAVREACELIMAARGTLEAALTAYLD